MTMKDCSSKYRMQNIVKVIALKKLELSKQNSGCIECIRECNKNRMKNKSKADKEVVSKKLHKESFQSKVE